MVNNFTNINKTNKDHSSS